MWWSAIRARGIVCSVFCYKSLWGWSGTYAVVYQRGRVIVSVAVEYLLKPEVESLWGSYAPHNS